MFVLKCNNCDTDVNYADAILRDVLTRGLYDSEIQLELLRDQNQMTLEQVFTFVEAKEAGRRSASNLKTRRVLNTQVARIAATKMQTA